MPTYEYTTKVSKGWPMTKKTLDEMGRKGWLLVGVVKITSQSDSPYETPYPVEEFWYYFVGQFDKHPEP